MDKEPFVSFCTEDSLEGEIRGGNLEDVFVLFHSSGSFFRLIIRRKDTANSNTKLLCNFLA
jgi:hypothetical protein